MSALSNALQSSAFSWPALNEVARQAGVTSRQASLVPCRQTDQRGSASHSLCAATGIDPVDGRPRSAKALSPNVVWWLLSGALYITRHLKKLDQRSAADVIGISAASVCRVEQGQPVSIGVMLKVCAFIGVHPFGYTAPLVCPADILSRETATETYCSRSDIGLTPRFGIPCVSLNHSQDNQHEPPVSVTRQKRDARIAEATRAAMAAPAVRQKISGQPSGA